MKKAFYVFLLLIPASFLSAQTVCGNYICEQGENCVRDCLLDTIMLLTKEGGRVDWCPDARGNLNAFDKAGEDGYYDIYTMNPDGSDKKCITCGNESLPKHNGQPAWHPSGDWIIFEGEKKVHPGNSRFSTPGRGVCCDLWVISRDGSALFNLTNLPVTESYGVLHPHFSADGKKLSWSEMYAPATFKEKGKTFGQFKLKVADFTFVNGVPKLSNVLEFIPGDSVLYENHGFSGDGKSLLFMSNFYKNVSPLRNNKIYKLDIATGKATLLADDGYNEHAAYSPDGNWIIYGSSSGNQNHGMDYWLMKPDGSGKQRLTYFNQKGFPEYITRGYAVDMSWSSDGKYLVAYVQDNLLKDSGMIYMIRFKKPLK